jgi:hypothetical protein
MCAYTGPPPAELPKSLSEPLNHVFTDGYAASTRLPREAGQLPPGTVVAVTPATGAHEPATPRSICEGACVRSWVAKRSACIVVSSVVRFSLVKVHPGGRKTKKESRSSGLRVETRRAFGSISERPADEGRDSR